jgi:peptidoglycan/xylan/chitin deacetylase (PgdA/CDA1 family)
MSEALFSFRWDIDHRACITDGLPRIQELCRDFQVVNTFFVNMGRSTNLREWLGKGFGKSRDKLNDMEGLNLIQKIGWPRFTRETLLGRPVGLSFIPELQALQAEGHELGLHGGMDHVVWSRRFEELPTKVLAADVGESHSLFTQHFGQPAGFSSPGFKSDRRVKELVEQLGYRYDGDGIGGMPRRARAAEKTLRHWTIPVTISGPRTIPFLEYHGAIGTSEPQILAEFDRRLRERKLVVLYGHPCYEGIHTELLRKVFRRVLDAGFAFVTHEQIAARLEREEPLGGAA